ncbi:unnamed protein product [Zymoseptoria tritici ST99CH_3D1]|nr:unnamed protein product [Zymoseptoria tritici ST99CH_3D1]
MSTTPQLSGRAIAIAPAAQVPTPDGNDASVELMQYACTTCTRRKVKCDKAKAPCSACHKGRMECIYVAPPPRERKRKRKPVEELQDRLERCEQLLRENGIQVKPVENVSPVDSTTSVGNAVPDTKPGTASEGVSGTLLQGPGKTRYIDSNIWRNLGDHLEDSDYDDHPQNPEDSNPSDPASLSLYNTSNSSQSLLNLHPTYDVAMKLWNIYVRNVDPIVKIVHVPSTRDLLQRAAANPSSMTPDTECLLFAIYLFSVISMSQKDFEQEVGTSWSFLHNRFHDAVRRSLVSNHFLRTTSLAVLQAYTLFLASVRNTYDPHTFWVLTGIAIRIGQRMGLHRDSAEQGLNPFDVQMRRRLFWQLIPLDGLAAQLSGTGIAIPSDSWDTKQPLNLDDADIWPGMSSEPIAKRGATDMIFCLARTEIGKFHQKRMQPGKWNKLWDSPDTPAVHKSLQDLETTMEENYIRYCDITVPVHCLTLSMARGVLNFARYRVALEKVKAPDATPVTRAEFVATVTKILDIDLAAQKNPMLERFQWHFRTFFQWDALIWLLTEMRKEDTMVDFDAAWNKVEQVYAYHPELFAWKRSIDVALARLTLRAWEATHKNAQATSAGRSEPDFIVQLRAGFEKREASRLHSPASATVAAAAPNPPYNYFQSGPTYGTDTSVAAVQQNLLYPFDGTETSVAGWPQNQDLGLDSNGNFLENGQFTVDPGWMIWGPMGQDFDFMQMPAQQ